LTMVKLFIIVKLLMVKLNMAKKWWNN
jgi:hypothetical protein